jgi:hypothetical protein
VPALDHRGADSPVPGQALEPQEGVERLRINRRGAARIGRLGDPLDWLVLRFGRAR